jgi:hypothetical protein
MNKTQRKEKAAQQAMEITLKALARIEAHEKECAIRYENIEKRLNSGSKRFDKLEVMIWAIYPFIVTTVLLAKYAG